MYGWVDYVYCIQLINSMKKRRKYLSEQEVLEMFRSILKAVEWLHCKGVIHRDIKTPNIFLTKAGVIKLGDLGVSK